jgi:hypothetical protein
MKLLDKIGDTLLARLVPGIDARANCGQCRYSHHDYRLCCPGPTYSEYEPMKIYMDLCGRLCNRVCDSSRRC